MTTNHTILDLNKVQHASFGYVNQYGHKRRLRPRATFLNQTVPVPKDKPYLSAKLDKWFPVVSFQLTANHCLTYTGDKAVAMWKAWQEKIFNKHK